MGILALDLQNPRKLAHRVRPQVPVERTALPADQVRAAVKFVVAAQRPAGTELCGQPETQCGRNSPLPVARARAPRAHSLGHIMGQRQTRVVRGDTGTRVPLLQEGEPEHCASPLQKKTVRAAGHEGLAHDTDVRLAPTTNPLSLTVIATLRCAPL